MKKIYYFLLLLLFTSPLFSQQNYVSDELIIQLNYKENINTTLQAINKTIPAGEFIIKEPLSEQLNIWLLHYNEAIVSKEKALLELEKLPTVFLAQVNHTNIQQRNNPPNDPNYSDIQWCHNNLGTGNAVAGADMDSELAWDITTGGVTSTGDTIVVAIVDGGFDIANEDLDFWVNRAEIPNNNIDDDANGYIDDIYGWNTQSNSGDVDVAGPWDTHATHVAGIVGAIGNNGKGVVGVNWNVKIMAIKGSSTQEAIVIKSYAYVLKQRSLYNETNGASGAFVVATNSSFGVDNGSPANYPIWCGFYDSLGVVGVLSAVAGPNNNVNIDNVGDVPGTCPSNYTISVTNTKNNDTKSNAGYGFINCDIGAPGEDIYSTLPDSAYGYKSGTSMATPQVAGAIALMYAAEPNFSNNTPSNTAFTIRNYMLTSGFDTIADLAGKCATEGRLNLYKCVNKMVTQTGINQLDATNLTSIFPNPAKDFIVFDSKENNIVQINIYSALGVLIYSNNNVNQQEKIDLSTYNSGIYFARLFTANNSVETQQFVILK